MEANEGNTTAPVDETAAMRRALVPASRALGPADPDPDPAVGPDADAAHLPEAAIPRVPRADPALDLPALLGELYRRDVRDVRDVRGVRDQRAVLPEGGPTPAVGVFAAAGPIDTLVGYPAPAAPLGAGPTAPRLAGIGTGAEVLRLDVDDVTRLDTDIRITARPRPADAGRTKES
ncbi:hypothetical protein [Embleya sp. AB8]|uniref:hypothetical protein n=1 Tax=Embleya sp. AB8 TaxID=3156304 RepID=UPI003C767CA4